MKPLCANCSAALISYKTGAWTEAEWQAYLDRVRPTKRQQSSPQAAETVDASKI
jgi:hypothetical protein